MWTANWSVFFTAFIAIVGCASDENLAKLPHCVEEQDVGYVLVSTLDGKLSALRANGELAWDIETNHGPLLTSSIREVELSKKGEWFRIIPSLSGSLYTFNGKTIDAIPVNADALLKSSFLLSNDVIIAGGRDVRTYGIIASSGEGLYECSTEGCFNMTSNAEDVDDVIVIERSTTTVRAHEPRSGVERWNFSVGSLEIKIPPSSCISYDSAVSNLNLSAILPQGILIACRKHQSEQLWQYHFSTPIVKVWKWNGRDLMQVDVLDQYDRFTPSPAIYLGMHNHQLYIHESRQMMELNAGLKRSGQLGNELIETESWTRFPWKPVPAGYLQEEVDDSTALSVLYSSNYVDGNGYYFYSADEAQKKERIFCDNNSTTPFLLSHFLSFGNSSITRSVMFTIAFVVITAIATKFPSICKWLVNRSITDKLRSKTRESSARSLETASTSEPTPTTTNPTFAYNNIRPLQSHFLDNFNIISQLGKGGYGIVFEVQQKFDNANYAVKIIPLPEKPAAKERVLREVRVLAQLEHPNIVRYSTSWDEEALPDFSHLKHIHPLLTDSSYFSSQIYEDDCEDESKIDICDDDAEEEDSFIVFEDETKNSSSSSSSIPAYRSRSKSICITMNSEIRGISPTKKREMYERSRSSHSPPKRSRAASIGSLLYAKKKERRYLFIQMQLCDKKTLKHWMQANSLRRPENIYEIYTQILCAVEYIHSKRLIHRDLKPSNIFFNQNGSTSQIKVGDFGLVTPMKNADADMLMTDACISAHTCDAGTALYMSPEQQKGSNYSYKVDIYSLGVILFELLVFFNTESERIMVLQNLRRGIFPREFKVQKTQEYDLLNLMLSVNAERRPAVSEVIEKIKSIQLDRRQFSYA